MDKKIIELFNLTNQLDREIGIEIEMEGRALPSGPTGWNTAADGSLRGESIEYVLRKPVKAKDVDKVLDRLTAAFKENGTELHPSDRCGVHVHVNCQQMTVDEVLKYCLLYLIVEDLLVKWCGEDREGNLFCLRSRDAEAIIPYLADAAVRNNLRALSSRDIRYAAINLTSLAKYGTLEFRALRTPSDFERIKTWVKLLLDVREASKRYNELHEMVEDISFKGAKAFVNAIFGERTDLLTCRNMDKLLMEAVRRVQDVAYARKVTPVPAAGELPEWYELFLHDINRWANEAGYTPLGYDVQNALLWLRRPDGRITYNGFRLSGPPSDLPDHVINNPEITAIREEHRDQQNERNRAQNEEIRRHAERIRLMQREREAAAALQAEREERARLERNAARRAARAAARPGRPANITDATDF